jgi:hypothetical protein
MTFHDPHLMAGGQIVLVTGPFGAPERQIALERPMTIAEAIAVHDLAFRLPTIAVMGGEPVMRGQWALRMVRPGETLAFVAVPGGGGGEGDISGKQILGLVAALALSIAAPMIGGALFGIGTIGASIASAAILAGGTMLLNALFAPPETESAAAADPIYSVTAASNQATPLDVVPVLYGELEFAPRYAARPYSEFAGNDQYLYQLFTVTAGKAEVKQVKIGETEAWNSTTGYSSSFSDLTFEVIQPGQQVTLFPANVVTSAEVSGQSVPDPTAVLGPFVVNAAGTTVDRLAVDFAFPGGLWTADGRAVTTNSIALRAQYQEIDNAGAPIGGWNTLFAETISAATRTPQRMTRAADVPAARYQVRFLSDEAFDPDDGLAVNSVAWVGLRGYLTGFETPANTTLLAMRVRANEQLSQLSSSQIRVLAERHLPVWNGSTWTVQATRSIAWAAADILNNADYSLGLTDGQYDLAGLTTLAATWAGRGDTFNAIFDRAWTAADALRAVLRAGRAQPVRIAGKLGFVRLQPRSIKRATFTQRNVIRGSFQHKLVLFDEEKPDSVIGRYIDATTWSPREVKAQLASVGGDAPQTLDWFGITDREQVWRESVTEAAVNAYQREFVSFTADWEGKLLVRGDPILVQHPFVQGVQTASLEAHSGDALTLDRDIDPVAGDIYVILRGKDGKEWGPCLADSIVDRVVTLNAADRAAVVTSMGSLASILPGARSERAHVLICDGEMRPFNGLVVSAVPRDDGQVEVLAVIDAPEVYLADGTEIMPSPWTPPTLPPQNPARPLLLGLYAELRPGTAQLELDAMWQPSAGAIGGYVAEVSYDDDVVPDSAKSWTPVYAGPANRFTVPVLPQKLVLRVAAIGVLQGPWTKRVFVLADVPDISLTPDDFYPDLGDTLEVLNQGLEWLAASNKKVRDDLQSVVVRLQDQGNTSDDNFQQLRTALSVETDLIKADYELLVTTAVGILDGQIVGITSRVETLEVAYADPVTGNAALASGLDAIVVQITDGTTGLVALANSITGIETSVGDISADAKIRMVSQSSSGDSYSTVGIQARATTGDAWTTAAILLDAKSTGESRVLLVGQKIGLMDSGGTVYAMFDATGAYFATARIQDASITNAKITDATITSAKIADAAITSAKIGNAAITNAKIGTLAVGTINLADGAVTVGVSASNASTTFEYGTPRTCAVAFSYVAGSILLNGQINIPEYSVPAAGLAQLNLYRNGSLLRSKDVPWRWNPDTDEYWMGNGYVDFGFIDFPPSAGSYTYTLEIKLETSIGVAIPYNNMRLSGAYAMK